MAMFQFGGVMCNAVARFSPRKIWRINPQQLLSVSSSEAVNSSVPSVASKTEDGVAESNSEESAPKLPGKNSMVQAVFASLSKQKVGGLPPTKNSSSVAKNIMSAQSVEKLLTIANECDISRRHALSIVSILSEWTNKNKISIDDFETDPRFLKICKQLAGKSVVVEKYRGHNHGELSTILGLTGDDEAAKLISTLSLDQMLKIMSTLAYKQKRSTTILRSLSYNIGRSSHKLNIKQAADLLYAMAKLNFPDEVLLEKATADLLQTIPTTSGNAVINSIITSMGILRFKNVELLDALCEWIVAENRSLKPQAISSILLTLAAVAHIPANVDTLRKILLEPLGESDLPKSEVWLDVVWSSVVLGIATPVDVSSVLDAGFIKKLSACESLTLPRKIKLLNINAAAKLIIPQYEGGYLDSNFEKSTIDKGKDKQTYAYSIKDMLTNLYPADVCLNRNINTGMGFMLDVECYVDDKCNPLPVSSNSEVLQNATRLAFVPLYYNDYCRGAHDVTGINSLIIRLLEAKGYTIVDIPYTEYDEREKLSARLKYIERKIKSAVSRCRT